MAIIGTVLGDISGSQYEFENMRPKDLHYKKCPLFTEKCRFTDDTVMSLATKVALQKNLPFANTYREFGRKYPNAGYGWMFHHWIHSDSMIAYNSFGNGSAMLLHRRIF